MDYDGYFISYGIHQEYLFLKIHPFQIYGYIFATTFILTFDTRSFQLLDRKNITAIASTFHMHAVEISETYAVLAGFYVQPNVVHYSVYAAFLVALNTLKVIDGVILHAMRFVTARAFSYNRDNDISVAINHKRHLTLIGLPIVSRVVLLKINFSSPDSDEWTLKMIRDEIGPTHCTGFGRSVVWINDTTVAVAILLVPNRPWSQSEVWIFSVEKAFKTPLFIFPNNQQNFILSPLLSFLQIFIFSQSLVIVTDEIYVLIVPSQPAGYVSTNNNNHQILFYTLNSVKCSPGTFKSISGFGPCTICPPQTKNTGNEPCTRCEPCQMNSFCPLGSVVDVSLEKYPSYIQTFSYPNSPDMNNYDDLLVQNIFSIGYSNRCIVISPLFWTVVVVIILCCMIWFFMALLQLYSSPNAHSHRTKAKKLFKRLDIVGEGDRWVGGLFSFAIAVLFGFTFWFSTVFLQLYPVETSDISYASCDKTIRNAVFQSSLQLPLPNSDGKQWTIFDMLENQPFTVTIDLLNTAADCSSITVQQNRPGVYYLLIPITSCVRQPDNVTISVSFPFPEHRANVQLNITGSSFIGGMRLCLRGPDRIESVHTLQMLDMCQLFFTLNETLSRITTLHVVLIKVINETKPLKIGDNTYYTGRWAPTFAENSLSDKLIYEQNGFYLRYMSERTLVSITLSEQPFYLQNIQQPIVRRSELAFHTLLFCTLIIELFGMAFLLFRLVILPLIHTVRQYCHQNRNTETIVQSSIGTTEPIGRNHFDTNELNMHP